MTRTFFGLHMLFNPALLLAANVGSSAQQDGYCLQPRYLDSSFLSISPVESTSIVMDHLPIPEHCKVRQMVVPHLNLVKYDCHGYFDFLERLGHSNDELLKMLHDEATRPLGESIVQEWLYFGVLHHFSDVCGVPLALDEFISVDGHDKKIVSSKPWPRYLAAISGKTYTHEQHGQIQAGMEHATTILGRIVSSFKVWYEHLTPPVMFSIFILVESLAEGFRSISGQPVNLRTHYMSPSPGLFFEKRMKENGWCLSSIQAALHGNASTSYFASLLPSYSSEMHPDCTDYKCKQVTKQVSDVTCQHVATQCSGDCGDVSLDQSQLTDILDQGLYPAITGQDIDGAVKIEVVDAESQPFIAISHVWAHGLGNPNSNAIPVCQIRRLFNLIKQANAGRPLPALWMDTLCVPVHSKPHRKLSISKLRKVYSAADKVLVLDRRLAQVDSGNTSEVLCHILCSEWMGRLWTLQEGLLRPPEAVYIQLQNGAIPLKSILDYDSTDPSPHMIEARLRSSLSSRFIVRDQFGEVADRHQSPSYSPTPMIALVQNLQCRRTTRATDEPICIATLLDIDLTQFTTMPSMEDIFRNVSRLPRVLMFLPGPRLETPGFRWAPSTFLEQPITGLQDHSMMSAGLVRREGFDLSVTSIKLRDSMVIAQKNKKYIIEFPDGNKDFFFNPDFTDYPDFTHRSFDSPAILFFRNDASCEAAVLVSSAKVLWTSRGQNIMAGHYELPGFIVGSTMTGQRIFSTSHDYDTVHAVSCMTQNWIVD